MNTIFIHDLRLATRIGAHAPERQAPQTIRLDLTIGLASDRPFHTDDLADAVDYAAVVQRITRFAEEHRCHLLERFAGGVAEVVLGEFAAAWVKVRVAKLAVVPGVREIGVAIERHRA